MKNQKELPPVIRDKQLAVAAGETLAFRDGRLLALAWQAKSKKKATGNFEQQWFSTASRRHHTTKDNSQQSCNVEFL